MGGYNEEIVFMIPKTDEQETVHMRAQDFFPHTCNVFLQQIASATKRGFTQEQTALIKSFDKDYFKYFDQKGRRREVPRRG